MLKNTFPAVCAAILLPIILALGIAGCGPTAPDSETDGLTAEDAYTRLEQAMTRPDQVFHTVVRISQEAGPLSYRGGFEFWADPQEGRARQAMELTPKAGDAQRHEHEIVLHEDLIYPAPVRGISQATYPALQCPDASALVSTAIGCWRFDRTGETSVEAVHYQGEAAVALTTDVAWSGSDERFEVTRKLYLDAETYLPIALEVEGTVDYGEVSEVHSLWTYENDFLTSDSLPDDFFDPASIGYAEADAGAPGIAGTPRPPRAPSATPTPTPPAPVHSRVPASSASRVVDANNRFALDLLAELRRQEGDQNLFVSPLSIALAMAITYNGAAGETREAMAQALHLDGMDRDEVNRANAALLVAMADREPDLELGVANSIWAREDVPFHQSFYDRVGEHYNAEIDSLPFDDAAKESINGWVEDQTQGKIESILDQVNPSDVMYLINAVYFKASWWHAFQEENTRDGHFHNSDGSEVEVPMMHQEVGKYDYLDGDGFSALRLRYQGDASMYIFLPDLDSSLPEFLDLLDGDAWAKWIGEFQRQGSGEIVIPRFELEYEANLNDALKALGMEAAFGGGADFSEMGPDGMWIDRVVHKAVVEVHEEGTEAAAATMVAILQSAPAFTFEFVVDRPFFFAITDDQTGSVLFMGVVHEFEG